MPKKKTVSLLHGKTSEIKDCFSLIFRQRERRAQYVTSSQIFEGNAAIVLSDPCFQEHVAFRPQYTEILTLNLIKTILPVRRKILHSTNMHIVLINQPSNTLLL